MADSQQQGPRNPDKPMGTGAFGGEALLLRGARLTDGRIVDVTLVEGRIDAVGVVGSLNLGASKVGSKIELHGYLLLPAPAEPHAHHDTAFTAGTVGAAVDAGVATASRTGRSPAEASPGILGEVQRRVTEAALLQLGHGATAARTHVRIGDAAGLGLLEAVLAARRTLRGLTELTAVAVPRLLTGVAGAEGLAMLRDAVGMGATAVGGCPDLDPDPMSYTEKVLNIAAEHGCPLDLHTEALDPDGYVRLAAMASGLPSSVTLSPCNGLGLMAPHVVARVADQLAATGTTVAVLPQGGCALTNGQRPQLPAPVSLLRSAGVRVTAGSGALRDASNPVGRGDPLEAAYLLAAQGGATADDAYDAVSGAARAALGLPDVRLEPGFPAELLAVRGPDLAAALSLSYSRVVLHRGRVVARTSAVREFRDAEPGGPSDLPRQAKG